MKTFEDLEFKTHGCAKEATQAVMFFENGYGVSLLFGFPFYSNGIDTYELAVIHRSGEGSYDLRYDTGITDDVLGYITKEEVTEAMKKVQELKPIG